MARCTSRTPFRTRLFGAGASMAIALGGAPSMAATPAPADPLAAGFQSPPNSARPRVWWHWMNGNVTKEGVRLDLEWMKRVGIGGMQNFDASLFTPKLVDRPLIFMTPEWKDAFRYAASLADQLDLEMAIAGSPGWSESGGPWVTAASGMKKLVWTETRLNGGRPYHGVLTRPPGNVGPYQDLPLPPAFLGDPPKPVPDFYVDSAVVAYRLPASDLGPDELKPVVTSSAGPIDTAALSDGDVAKAQPLAFGPNRAAPWVRFDYGRPVEIQAMTLGLLAPYDVPFTAKPAVIATLEASDDGRTYRKVADLPGEDIAMHTLAFPKVSARYFRITLPDWTKPVLPPGLPIPPLEDARDQLLTELVLHTGPRVNRVQDKAGFAILPDLYPLATPATAPGTAPARTEVVDLTARMQPDGTLDWTPPPGRWVVLRLGYSPLGIENHPASPAGTGLEVDKLSRDHVRDYMATYLGLYRDAAGPGLMGEHGVRFMVNDSWEAGPQNWTEQMIPEFAKRRGYDMRPWLPVLTGQVIESGEASDRFLWDFRKTLSEMLVDNHYGELNRALHAHGMGHYGESHEAGRAILADGMDIKRGLDIPMSAMWAEAGAQQGYEADIRESASVAHLWGQNLVAAESFTAFGMPGGDDNYPPERLKATADRELASGLNRFVIHTSVHQPFVDKAPGIALGPFGQWFTRLETWGEMAGPFISYLSRSDYLLQQGRFAADVAWFYGEDSNVTAQYATAAPPVPQGYAFDYVNATAVTDLLSVKDGRLTTPAGASFRVLALDPRNRLMTLTVLKKLHDLVEAGALVWGARPETTPSLADDPAEFARLAELMWGADGLGRKLGLGEVKGAGDLAAALAETTAPDVDWRGIDPSDRLAFVHRALAEGDLYFVSNPTDRAERLSPSFRVAGREAEIWRADSGAMAPTSYRTEAGRTVVPLDLAPHDALFVVFRTPAKAAVRTIAEPARRTEPVATGRWEVAFQPGRGAPAAVALDHLAPLSEQADPGVKYFSGVATYRTTLQAPRSWFARHGRVWLDLGEVQNLAEVRVNGQLVGAPWKTPFRVDASGALKPGPNQVEIRVADTWVNRMIGDKQPGATPVAFTTNNPYPKDFPLPRSGLIGPLTVLIETR